MKTKLLLTAVLFGLCLSATAQVPQKEVDTHLVLAQDYMRQKNYAEAKKALHWFFTKVPDYNKDIYIMGYKAYEKVAEVESSAAQKAVYLDSMITVFRLKEKQFGLTDREYNNLAFRYYKYFRNDKSRYDEAIATFEKVYENPESVILNNFPAYLSIIRQYSAKVEQLSAPALLDIRAVIAQAEVKKREAGTDPAKLKRFSDLVDQLFYETIKPALNCEVIAGIASNEKLTQYDFARMVFAWSMEFECTSFDYFELAAKTIANNPEGKNAGILTLLAKKAAADGRYQESIELFQDALPLVTDSLKKANTHMDMARVYSLLGEKSSARSAAFKAIETSEELSSMAYSFVANLYMGSYEDCRENEKETVDRAIFMAAYDLFQKAMDFEGMEAAKAQFPTRSQAFTERYEDGEVIDIGCWIKVKTKVKTRSSQ